MILLDDNEPPPKLAPIIHTWHIDPLVAAWLFVICLIAFAILWTYRGKRPSGPRGFPIDPTTKRGEKR